MQRLLLLCVFACLVSAAPAAEPIPALDRLTGAALPVTKDFKAPKELCAILGEACEPHPERWYRVAFSPEGTWLAATRKGGVRLWNLKQPELKALDIDSRKGVQSMAFTPDGKTLACGTGGQVVVWDLSADKPKQVAALESDPQDYILGVAFLDNARLVAASGHKRTVRFWDISDGKPKLTATVILKDAKDGDRIYGLAAAPDGKTLVTGQRYGSLAFWDPMGGALKEQVPAKGSGGVFALAFAPDGKTMASGQSRAGLHVWDLAGEKPAARILNGPGVFGVAFAPDGKLLAAADVSGTVQLLDLASLKATSAWKLPNPANHVAFSPDGRYLAATANNSLVYVFRLTPLAAAGP